MHTSQSDTSAADGTRLPASKVWKRYGIVDRTLDRWIASETLGFPKPIVINRRRYFRESDLIAWERKRASTKSEAA
jgi:hypothetical protein